MSDDLTAIPVLDYSLLTSDRPKFPGQLRRALIHVGFLYLRGTPIETHDLLEQVPHVFALPQESKAALSMRNSQHFLGYASLGKEFTKGARDMREQFAAVRLRNAAREPIAL